MKTRRFDTIEASMLLKTNKGISETNSNELKLGAQMREMDAKSELFDGAHFPAVHWHGGMRWGSKLSERGEPTEDREEIQK